MNYRELLKKYMKGVVRAEDHLYVTKSDFTEEELAELYTLAQEVYDEEENK